MQSTDKLTSTRFFNREISDLAFIERVLDESSNPKHPLLSRLEFLGISASVLDQFYGVHVARLRRKIDEGDTRTSVDGLTPAAQLRKVNQYADNLLRAQQASWIKLGAELAIHNIRLQDPAELSGSDLDYLQNYYSRHVMPVLSPFMIDREHPFPFIPSGGLCVVAEASTGQGETTHLLVPMPPSLARFILLPGEGARIISLESIIIFFIQSFFSELKITNCGTFQILRDNDLALEERFDDLLQMVATSLERRERANVIRLKFAEDMPEEARFFIAEALGVLSKDDVDEMRSKNISIDTSETIAIDSLVGLSDSVDLINSHLGPKYPDLKFPSYEAKVPDRISRCDGDYFSVLRERDMILHWPYDSFNVLVEFIQSAATDPDVLAIKQTLYRTSSQSPIVNALIAAAESGKAVIAVIELEARDNEKANIALARRMERAGVQIVYGIIDLKVHCKMTLIVRREKDGTTLYTHFGTGNYHPGNARTYTDLAYFTADKTLGEDCNKVFNYLTSGSPPACQNLHVAPSNIRTQLFELLDIEIQNAAAGKPAQLWAKLNSLSDPALIDKLYEASNSGVQIELVVRRQCRLKPGVPGMSENIRVKSIVGRFLEHSRIYSFANGESLPHANAKTFLSSADWMERNFDDRVEVMIPLTDPIVHKQVLEDVLARNIEDNEQSWYLQPDGEYVRPQEAGFSAQEWFMENQSISGR